MDIASARLGRYQLQPTGTNQTIKQGARLFSIKPAAERLTTDIQQRYLGLLVYPNPAQCAAGVVMLFSQPNLPERRSAVRPEVFSPQPYSGRNVLFANGLRFGAAEHGPVQVGQRATQSQDMGGALGSPFPFAAVQICLRLCQKGPKGLKGPEALRRQVHGSWCKDAVVAGGQIDDARQCVLNFRLDFADLIGKRHVCRFFRPRKVKPRIHAVLIALKSPSNLVWLQTANDAHQQVA